MRLWYEMWWLYSGRSTLMEVSICQGKEMCDYIDALVGRLAPLVTTDVIPDKIRSLGLLCDRGNSRVPSRHLVMWDHRREAEEAKARQLEADFPEIPSTKIKACLNQCNGDIERAQTA